MKTVKNTTWAN